MKILKGIEIKNKALWLPKSKTLIIADLHLGYEEALAKQGILAPRMMFQEMRKEIQELLRINPRTVIINGDLKHEFGQISRQEWHDTLELLDLLLRRSKVILIKGNHDMILESIARRKNLEIKEFYITGNMCILHGHKILLDKEIYDKKIKTVIIGHEHPAVSLREGAKAEKYKCFLLGKWHKKNLIVMPSFFTIFEGSDVKIEKLLSPYLDEKTIGNFEVFVLGDKVYRFGKLNNIE